MKSQLRQGKSGTSKIFRDRTFPLILGEESGANDLDHGRAKTDSEVTTLWFEGEWNLFHSMLSPL